MYCYQINIHKNSRTARSYNPMLHVVTETVSTHIFPPFQAWFLLLRWARCDCILKVKATIHQGLAKSLTGFYVLRVPMHSVKSCWVWIRMPESPLALVEGHAPPQTINQWALELRGYAAHIPRLLQGNKDALFPAQKYTNTSSADVLYSNRIQ